MTYILIIEGNINKTLFFIFNSIKHSPMEAN